MRKTISVFATMLAAVMLLAAAPAPSVHAAETVVTSTDNEGPGTLREAILSASPGRHHHFRHGCFRP